MTTLDRNGFLAGKLREFYESHHISTEILEAANVLDALSSIPEQGSKPAIYIGMNDVVALVTDDMADTVRAAFDALPEPPMGEKVLPLYLAPSHPAAVAVTDEMVERSARKLAADEYGMGDPAAVVATVVEQRWREFEKTARSVLEAALVDRVSPAISTNTGEA